MIRSCPRTRKPTASFEATNISQRLKSCRSSMPPLPRWGPARSRPPPRSRRLSQNFGNPEAGAPRAECGKCSISAMANKLGNGSSLEAIINDAERSGASAEKARQIYDLVEANASSEYLRRFEIEFGPDSTDK